MLTQKEIDEMKDKCLAINEQIHSLLNERNEMYQKAIQSIIEGVEQKLLRDYGVKYGDKVVLTCSWFDTDKARFKTEKLSLTKIYVVSTKDFPNENMVKLQFNKVKKDGSLSLRQESYALICVRDIEKVNE